MSYPKIYFRHINKCAGTTLLAWLNNKYDPDRIFNIEGNNIKDLDFHKIYRAEFVHNPSGSIHQHLLPGGFFKILFLRDPLKRLISDYEMICRWSDMEMREQKYNYYNELKKIHNSAKGSFASFIKNNFKTVYNPMARSLIENLPLLGAWGEMAKSKIRPSESFKTKLLAEVRRNLRRFNFIGLVENFDESLRALSLALGFPPEPVVQKLNAHAKIAIPQAELDDLRDDLRELLDCDYALYQEGAAINRELLDRYLGGLGENRTGGDYRAASLASPPRFKLTAPDRALPGTSWQSREINGSKYSCWMGPEPRSSLHLRFDKSSPISLNLIIGDYLDAGQPAAFNLSADEKPVALYPLPLSGKETSFAGFIFPGDLDSSSDILRLVLDCGFTSKPADPNDPRLLGLEFLQLELKSYEGWIQNYSHSFAGPFMGTNWSPREVNGYKVTRWISPEARAELFLFVDRLHDLRLEALITSWIDLSQVERLRLEVDGLEVPLKKEKVSYGGINGFLCEAVVKADRTAASGLTRLVFDCGETLKPPLNGDLRKLGLEFSSLSLDALI